MIKKYKITNMDRLQMAKKISRESNFMPKPMVTIDRKKEANKKECRTKPRFNYYERG